MKNFIFMKKIWNWIFRKFQNLANHHVMNSFLYYAKKNLNNRLIEHYFQYRPKDLVDYIKEFDFQYSDITDEEMTLLVDMLLNSRVVYFRHKFDVGKTRQNFHVTLKSKGELKRQRPSKVPLHLK